VTEDEARALLRLFCERAKALAFPESPFPETVLSHLVSAFERYLSGEEKDLERALGLKRRGRPADPEIKARNLRIAIEIEQALGKGNTLTKESGVIAEIAQRYGLGASEVRDAYYRHRNEARGMIIATRLNEADAWRERKYRPDWPDDADGDVFRGLEAAGFDFKRRHLIDFNVDFEDWPPDPRALSILRANHPSATLYDQQGDRPGYVLVQVYDYLDYDYVLEMQRMFSKLLEPFGGSCTSWGVLNENPSAAK
jgi:hypothetical protein